MAIDTSEATALLAPPRAAAPVGVLPQPRPAPPARRAAVDEPASVAPRVRVRRGRTNRLLAVTDPLCVVLAVGAALAVRAGTAPASLVAEVAPAARGVHVSYAAFSLALAAGWVAALALGRTRDHRILGHGPAEYARVVGVTTRVFALVAIVSYLLHAEVGRAYVAVAAPLGIALLTLNRYVVRQVLHRARARGRELTDVVVVGPREKVAGMVDFVGDGRATGLRVVGACVPHGAVDPGESVRGVAVHGGLDDVAAVTTALGASMVVVAGSDAVTAHTVRRLGWDLEGRGIDLALSVALLDVAGPRVTLQPVSGTPFVFVDEPTFTGAKYAVKTAIDLVGAALVTVALAPLLLVVAALVALTSRGPVLYRQERIGRDGAPFPMFKFRSMQVGADQRLAEVLAAEGREVGLFYKPVDDPRVTPVGRFIRRYSIDELPQLVNVLRGEMSLVGPRPQIAAEVAQYDRAAFRRLRVKPGMTGLWQVSGRSALSPEESIRLDVSYVENWSPLGDLLVLARTAKAVVAVGDSAR
ncbi:sugar transferase [Cellulomonas sp. DKR-3]|uniref:Sugar transferase n=1 Tax=Cellulomonas fulva TaxID=2835530 RepID=A0ABS5TVB8_9CELL|nr:sugar transferase [Cellulomonas fulva]MBT0993101.1 sugar transferase [Cellulomonas fulva]